MTSLDSAFETLEKHFIDINGYQTFIKSTSKVAYTHYVEEKERAKDVGFDEYAGGSSLIFKDIETDQHQFPGKSKFTFEDLIQSVTWHNNKQYQGLLAEAYEAFEDYLEELYDYIQLKENDFFKNISKKQPIDILKRIGTKIPVIAFLEKNNQQNRNYLFRTILISKLRHVIVHSGGFVENTEELLNKTTGEIGLCGNKGDALKYKEEMKFYLGKKDSQIFVLLLEYTQDNDLPFHTYHDRLQNLIKDILAYAKLLHDFTGRYFSDEENVKKLATDLEFYRDLMNNGERR